MAYETPRVIAGLHMSIPINKVHGANMGPIWDRQDPGGPHVGPMNFAIWVCYGMKKFSSVLVLCELNPLVTLGSNRKGSATWGCDIFFDDGLHKLLKKQ